MKYWILFFLLSPLAIRAAILSLGGSTIYLSDETTPLPVGSFVSIGYFEAGFTDFAGLTAFNWDELSSSVYTEVSTGMINPVPGEWAGGGNIPGIEGHQLFAWVFDSTDAPDGLINTEFGLFSGSSIDWTARGDGDLFHPQFNFLTVESVDIILHGARIDENLSLAPAPGTLAAIPEPSAAALVFGILAAGMLARRLRPGIR